MSAETTSRWLLFDKQPSPDDIILFCLPYAGGGASIYRLWQKKAPANVALCRVQLPGREGRISDPPLTRMEPLLDELSNSLQAWRNRPFAFFGHSMGGIIAAELTQRFQMDGLGKPWHLFIAGSRPPHTQPSHLMHQMTRSEFRQALSRNGGTPKEILECDELMDVFEPGLRADYAVLETWAPQPVRKLTVPMTVLAGLHDEVVPHSIISQWKHYAANTFRQINLEAGHFFVRTHTDQVMQILYPSITSLTSGVQA